LGRRKIRAGARREEGSCVGDVSGEEVEHIEEVVVRRLLIFGEGAVPFLVNGSLEEAEEA